MSELTYEQERQKTKNLKVMEGWQKQFPNEFLAFDGIVNYEEYNRIGNKKILFILREVNDGEGWKDSYDITKYLSTNGYGPEVELV